MLDIEKINERNKEDILYGVIPLETIGERYNKMAKELDAQLFVYDKESGKFVIDTINPNGSNSFTFFQC